MDLGPLALGMFVLAILHAVTTRPSRTDIVPPATDRYGDLIDRLPGDDAGIEGRDAEAWERVYRAASSIIGR